MVSSAIHYYLVKKNFLYFNFLKFYFNILNLEFEYFPVSLHKALLLKEINRVLKWQDHLFLP